eukprot:766125-Hanusia_phi.AAC.1
MISSPLLLFSLLVPAVAAYVCLLLLWTPSPVSPCHGTEPPVVISHRGYKHGLVTSSRESIEALTRGGVCRFDLDLSRSSEGELYIGHPAEMRRMLNVSGEELQAMTMQDLQRGSAGAILPLPAAVRLVLGSPCPASVDMKRYPLRLLLEPKGQAAAPDAIQKLVDVLAEEAPAPGAVGIWLQDSKSAKEATEALRGKGVMGVWFLYSLKTTVAPSSLSSSSSSSPSSRIRTDFSWDGVGPASSLLTPALAEEARKRGQTIVSWTVDDMTEACKCWRSNASAIVSNEPEAIISQWCKSSPTSAVCQEHAKIRVSTAR